MKKFIFTAIFISVISVNCFAEANTPDANVQPIKAVAAAVPDANVQSIIATTPDANAPLIKTPRVGTQNANVQAIKTGQTESFKKNYRNVDVLLIDDIHFISGKEQTP